MALFGGLFEKKTCDLCGGEIGALGNKKLEDGNCCKNCVKKLSPFFSDRRHSTVEEIREQLEYREANKADVEAFNVTRTFGTSPKVLIDEDAKKFIVTYSRKWKDENPDVIRLSQVTGCDIQAKESKREIKKTTEDGKSVSYTPPKYEYDYDFYDHIHINSPYFDEINIHVNDGNISSKYSAEYRTAEAAANELKAALEGVRQEIREDIAAAAAPKKVVKCPHCGGNTTPDASGLCEWCGSPVE